MSLLNLLIHAVFVKTYKTINLFIIHNQIHLCASSGYQDYLLTIHHTEVTVLSDIAIDSLAVIFNSTPDWLTIQHTRHPPSHTAGTDPVGQPLALNKICLRPQLDQHYGYKPH